MEYEPRPLQREIHASLKRFNVIVAHRRFGKSVLAINQLIQSALLCKKPAARFAYVAPYRSQAKTVAWDFLLQFTRPFIRQASDINIADLRVDLVSGGRVTLYGADNPDALRGIYLDGAVLDEYADMIPRTWSQVLRPALADRHGWAIFIGTPKGQNAFYDLYEAAKLDPLWYATMLKASATGVIDPNELAQLKKEMAAEEYAQEFECSFAAANIGAYYGKELAQAEADKRICRVPWEPSLPVTTAWDLGIDDATAIWFVQQLGREVRVIDYYENSGASLSHYAAHLRSKPYVYGEHLLPHDAEVKELGTGLSRVEVLQSLGLRPTIVKLQRVEDGINAVRMMLPRCYFDAEKTTMEAEGEPGDANKKRGLPSLRMYQREWNQKEGVWRARPKHDWASHACLTGDAMVRTAKGLRAIRTIHRGEFVWTPNGYAKVLHAGPVKMAHSLIKIQTVGGNTITCTKEHKFLTKRGFIAADALSYSDHIYNGSEWPCILNTLISRAINTGFRATITGETAGHNRAQATCIGRFGLMLTAQFQMALKFITSMAIHSIMPSLILKSKMPQNTSESICWSGLPGVNLNHPAQRHLGSRPCGIQAQRVSNGTSSTARKPGRIGHGLRLTVSNVASRLSRLILRGPSSAMRIAKLLPADLGAEPVLVYDLTVEKHACYQANGLLVSNSDAFRYLAIGLKPPASDKPIVYPKGAYV